MKRLTTITAALACFAGAATSPALAQSDTLEEQVQTLLTAFHTDYDFPGATIAYVLANGTSGDAVVGLADVEAGVEMTPTSRMLAASIGKTFVGALVLSLEDDGAFNRTDRVSQYLGDAPWFDRLPNAQDITIGHLLTHSSGLPDHVYLDGAVAHLITLGNDGNFQPEPKDVD